MDQNLTNTAVETVTATITSPGGDAEPVTLTETGTNTGIFAACLDTSTNSAALAATNLLYAPVGSVLTLTYTDPNDPADTTTATTTIVPPPGTPGIAVNKTLVTPATGQAVVGDTVQFNLQVANTGSTTLTNISLTDTFPDTNLTYVSASLAPSSTTPTSLTWTNLGALAIGTTTNLTVTFTAAASGSATNAAAVNSGAASGSGSAVVTITQPALLVTKTLLSPTNSPVSITSNVVFRIIATNTGDTAIPTLPLEDTFSAAYLEYVSATIAPDGSGAGSLFWANLAGTNGLAVGVSITNDITMLVVGAGNPALNTATVDFAVDINGKPVPPTSSVETNLITAAARISGMVYNDTNQNGALDLGETGLADVTLSLYTDPNGDGDPADGTLTQLVTSDATGAYELLNLVLGNYVVVETDLAGYSSSAPVNNRRALTLTDFTASAATTNVNFFDYQPAPASYGNILGTVYYDANGDSGYNPGEIGIPNVSLDLVQDANTNGLADFGEPVVASTTTATNGNYAFLNVTPDYYVVRETELNGYYSTGDSVGTNDNQMPFTLTAAQNNPFNNFYDRLAPTAVDDTNSVPRNVATVLDPLPNDISPDGDALTITNAVTTNGLVVINPGGTNLTFTATNLGPAYITYTITDLAGGTATALITVTVTNLPPVANDDATNTLQNVPVTIAPLGNDTDPNGDPLTITGVSPTNGTISSLTSSNFSFTPDTDFTGTATIGYTISDGNGGTSTALITVTVTATADLDITKTAPTNVLAGANFDYTITITNLGPSLASSVTVTDSLPANVIFVSAVPPATVNGSEVVWTNLGSLAANSATSLTLTVTAPADGASLTNFASAGSPTGDPNPTNNTTPPVVTAVTPVADLVVFKTGPVGEVLPGANYDYTIIISNFGPSLASSVTVTDALPANVTFFGATGGGVLSGSDVIWTNVGDLAAGAGTNFTLTVTAPLTGSVTNTASVGGPTTDPNPTNNFTPPVTSGVSNVPPVANDDSYTTAEDTALTVPAISGVLTNDTDANGDALTIILVTGPTNGVLTLNTNTGSFTYTPNTNFNGADSFTYRVNDGVTDSGVATVSLTVTAVNDAPEATPLIVVTPEDISTNLVVLGSDLDSTNLIYAVLVGPTNGSLGTLNSTSGAVTYTPNTNYTGPDAFTFTVCDGTLCATGLVSLTVTPVNDAPVASPLIVVTPEDTATNIVVLGTDLDSTNLTYAVLAGPTNGTLGTLNSTNGAVTYTPVTNYAGPDAFTFTVCDGDGLCATGLVSLTVTPVNDAPLANDQFVVTPEDNATNIVVVGSDIDSSNLVYTVLVGPTNGTLSVMDTNTGAVTYLPATNYSGPDAFMFTVCNGTLCATGLVSITVTPVNDAPEANDQFVVTPEDIATNIVVLGTDLDSTNLTYAILAGPTNGVLTAINPTNGAVTYTPTGNYNGPDAFTFTVCDGDGLCATGLVSVSVTPVNDAPVAQDLPVVTPEDVSTNLVVLGTDLDSTNLTYAVLVGPTNGALGTLNATNGAVIYTPATNYNGPDAFTFTVCDGELCATGLVSLMVTPVNDAPLAQDQIVFTPEDVSTNLVVTGSDIDSSNLTYTVLVGPTNGSLGVLNATNGAVTYTPTLNYNGPDAFTFTVCDGDGLCATGLVSITVTPVNDAPVATPLTVVTPEDVSTNLVVLGSDIDSSNLIYTVLAGPTNGTLSVMDTNTGAVTYSPATNYTGPDAFTFTVCDGTLCATGLVSITVMPVNDAPVAVNDEATTPQDTPVTINVLTNDFDVDGDSLTITNLIGVTNGTVAIVGTNLFYTPETNFYGTNVFSYAITDGSLFATGVVTVVVSPVPTTATALTNLVVCPGEVATFGTVAGGSGPFSYIWRKDGVAQGTTSNSLTIAAADAVDAGTYTVEVSGFLNTVTNSATLTVNSNVAVTTAPVDQTNLCLGGTANFTVDATGTGLAYQWYHGTNLLADATNSVLTVSNVDASVTGIYSVVLGGVCNSVTNSAALALDSEAPVIVCPADLTVTNAVGQCGSSVVYSIGASDNCGVVATNLLAGLASGALFPVGTTTNTFSVVDALGNSNVCTFTVTVVDNELPQFTCPATVVRTNDLGQCGATFTLAALVATDNCGGVTVTSNAPATFNVGTNTVTWTVVDSHANTNTCAQDVIITDAELPVINTPANITVAAAAGSCGSNVIFTVTATDNCGTNSVSSMPASGASFAVGTTTVTNIVTDIHGNTNTSTFTVTVVDSELPVINTPADITVNAATGTCGSNVTFTVTATDNCGTNSVTSTPASGSLFSVGTTTVTNIVTDIHGNTNTSTFTVTVVDNELPVINTPVDITVNAASGSCGSNVTFTVTATDNCGTNSLTSEPASGSLFPVGTTTVTNVAVDIHGNTNTSTFTVTVVDNELPVINTPVNITVDAAAGSCASNVTFVVTATDNCGTNSVSSEPASGASFPVGTTTVTNTAVDIHGNTNTSTFTVTVMDAELPAFTCPATVVRTNDLGQCGATFTLAALVATDNCGSVTVTSNAPATFNVGTNTVTWTVVDSHANTNTCTQDVIITDNELPQINTPVNITVDAAAGSCASNVTFVVTATDNCGTNSVSSEPASGASFPVGTTTVTNVVTDIHGNTNISTFTVTVADNELPVINTPADITVDAAAGACGSNVTFVVTATDNCGTNSVASEPASGSSFPVGMTTVTNIAVDIHGNTNTSTFTVTVVDNELPAINCPTAITVTNAPGQCGSNVTFAVTATDNCGTNSLTSTPASGSAFPTGTTTVTNVAIDLHGNSNVCTFTVTVVDVELPTIACPPDVVILALTATNVPLGAPVVGDNCGTPSVTNDAPASYGLGTNIVTWTVADASGNTNTCTQWVIVVDPNAPPVLNLSPITTVWNVQEARFEQRFSLTNAGYVTATGLRFYPVGFRAGNDFLEYPVGTNGGQPYVQYDVPITPGAIADFAVEILSLNSRPPTNTFRLETGVPLMPTNGITGTVVPVSLIPITVSTNNYKEWVLNWTSINGRRYAVQYLDNFNDPITWKTAVPTFVRKTTHAQWIDMGAPKTEWFSETNRFYRVLLLP